MFTTIHARSESVMPDGILGQSSVMEKEVGMVRYPEARVIVLNDNINTFEHVANSLRKIIPRMTEQLAWEVTKRVDSEGSAEAWRGALEQAELYHYQLSIKGLTMAPLERC